MAADGIVAARAETALQFAARMTEPGELKRGFADLEGLAFQGQQVDAGDHDVTSQLRRRDRLLMQA